MAKNNKNKGFSLIEIIIAIAILTILLTPILRQFAATMRMNRTAKRQQKVNENAQYVMEYFQNTKLSELTKTGDASKEIYATTEVIAEPRVCELYVAELAPSGKITVSQLVDSESNPVTIDYTVKKFELNPMTINNTQYNRTVYMDDLSTCMMAEEFQYKGAKCSFRVAYELPANNGGSMDVLGVSEFKRTNEGSYVKYDESGKYITAVVCMASDSIIANPNLMNAGNVHNLDSRGVALVTGYTSEYDDQAYAELYARAMERLREDNYDNWLLEMGGSTDSYVKEYGFDNNLLRMTEVTFKKCKEGNDEYYLVSVDVYYDSTYTVNGVGGHDVMKYNAYSQKFPCTSDSKPPYIYLEYQPMVVADNMGDHVEYAKNDYILFNNYVEGAKIYLYKPRWDYAHRYLSGNKGDAGYEESFTDEQYVYTYATADEKLILMPSDMAGKPDEYAKYKETSTYLDVYNAVLDRHNTYYTENYATDDDYDGKTKVKIHLGVSKDIDADVTDGHKPMQIYSNLDVDLKTEDHDPQFSVTQDGQVVGADGLLTDVTNVYGDYFKENGTPRNVDSFSVTDNIFKKIEDEENQQDRFYTISVYMDPVNGEGNTVVLHGAKGEY